MQRAGLGLLALVVTAVAGSASGAPGTQAFVSCSGTSKLVCASVTVPLDRQNGKAGSVRLHVEELPAAGSTRAKVIFLVAGGPGQASTAAFDLKHYGSVWQALFPGFTLVTYDDRGTGGSGRLNCPGLPAMLSAGVEETARIVGTCGRALGKTGSLYSTRANAADLDAVRAAVGADRITLYGVSYGTKQVLAYALAYPGRIDRLVLDSVAPTDWPDSFLSNSLGAIPGALAVLCQNGGCRDLGGAIPTKFVTLANRLAARPVTAAVPRPGARPSKVRLDGIRLLELAMDSDLNPGVAAELPAAVAAAAAGRMLPLERLTALDDLWGKDLFGGISLTVNVATECSDGSFPWRAGTALAKRSLLLNEAIAALPNTATAPFGRWAATAGLAEECKYWPDAAGGVKLGRGPLPNVPVLILSGTRDTRTPTSGARRVAADFPKAHVLIVPGAGHDLLGTSVCADRYVAAWLEGQKHGACLRLPLPLAALGPFPAGPKSGEALSPRATLAVVSQTLREAEATWLTTQGLHERLGGLAGGTLLPLASQQSFSLTRYSEEPGIELGGTIRYDPAAEGRWTGYIIVSGARAAPGRLVTNRGRLDGTLGSRRVSATLNGTVG